MVTIKTRYELDEDYERQKVFFEDENGDWVGGDYQNEKWALVEEQKKEYDKLLSDIRHCITPIYEKLFDERVKLSKKVLFGAD